MRDPEKKMAVAAARSVATIRLRTRAPKSRSRRESDCRGTFGVCKHGRQRGGFARDQFASSRTQLRRKIAPGTRGRVRNGTRPRVSAILRESQPRPWSSSCIGHIQYRPGKPATAGATTTLAVIVSRSRCRGGEGPSKRTAAPCAGGIAAQPTTAQTEFAPTAPTATRTEIAIA